MMWWQPCCSAADGEDASHDDVQVHRKLRNAFSTGQEALSASSSITLASFDDEQIRVSLPDLVEPRSSALPLCLERSCTDDSTVVDGSGLAIRRFASSEYGTYGKSKVLASALSVEDAMESSASLLPGKKRNSAGKRRSAQLAFVDTTPGPDSEVTEAQSLVYSSWFALLSKSIGSEGVGSPSWLMSTNKQIEGA